MAKYVKLNPKSSIFYDPVSKVKVLRNEVVEITDKQYNTRVIRAALSNGYLMEVDGKPGVQADVKPIPSQTEQANENPANVEELKSQFLELVEAGETPEKIKGRFNTTELKELALSMDIEPEDGDTKLDLVQAIMDELAPAQE